ncbi:class F sortase [Sporosarcina sp. NCCP-2716]|uniref:class F sortase n=1 Tax=Sporosarcina sp. NCCP-2716 TaxID=2943679 RepID=UPI00203A6562|nr:class F sortase [Sporosarcina sp. NCCP-2716]GKV70037.1 class F sortase [Sporosarcina sp. NCCP-2716]
MRRQMMFTAILAGSMALTAGCSTQETAVTDGTSAEIPAAEPASSPTVPAAAPEKTLQKEERGVIPASIEIPAIGVRTDIEAVGTLVNGQMGVPEDVNHVGWFEPGTMPGSQGSAVMAGHIDSLTGPAIFYKLDQLKPGDDVIVTGKEGQQLTFTVTRSEVFPRNDSPIDEIFGFSYGSRLNLITCTGDFNRKAKTHEERLVVYTELKEDGKTD